MKIHFIFDGGRAWPAALNSHGGTAPPDTIATPDRMYPNNPAHKSSEPLPENLTSKLMRVDFRAIASPGPDGFLVGRRFRSHAALPRRRARMLRNPCPNSRPSTGSRRHFRPPASVTFVTAARIATSGHSAQPRRHAATSRLAAPCALPASHSPLPRCSTFTLTTSLPSLPDPRSLGCRLSGATTAAPKGTGPHNCLRNHRTQEICSWNVKSPSQIRPGSHPRRQHMWAQC